MKIASILFVIIAGIYAQNVNQTLPLAEAAQPVNQTDFNSSNNVDNSNATDFEKYQQFINKYGKVYNDLTDLEVKFKNYKNSMATVQSLNSVEQVYGETIFSDMHPIEFSRRYLTFVPDQSVLTEIAKVDNAAAADQGGNLKGRNLQTTTYPASFDWRTYGAVVVAQDQGSCGSCWAFATVASIEGLYKIKYGVLYKFSEQQVLDCSTANYGCNGGAVSTAYNYLYNVGGLETQYGYGSYLGYQATCRFSSSKAVAQVTDWNFPGTSEVSIRNYLYNYGPVAVAIDATPLQYYTSGIINYSSCTTSVNHAVTLIGYGTSNGVAYWVVKNSWGTSWGENGFFRIVRGVGKCGINLYAVSAVLA